MKYAIVIEKAKRNYSAYVPDLPGCIATGNTLDEVRQTMLEAIEFHLEGMLLDGERVPTASTECCYLDIDLGRVKKAVRQEGQTVPANGSSRSRSKKK